jgi:pentatricopeptide repeat protein
VETLNRSILPPFARTKVAITSSIQVQREDEIEQSEKTSSRLDPLKSGLNQRFNEDMTRVLKLRQENIDEQLTRDRAVRPKILDTDIDGAERVLTMLNHLIDINTATEESFRIAMNAFLRRGRFRWMRDQHVTCAADQIEDLLEKLIELKSPSDVSLATYNLALEAYAVCSTPRGERDYARRAESLVKRMEQVFGILPVESYKHVLHAFAWQQANLEEGECARKACELLKLIEQRTEDGLTLMQCYDWTLEVWSKSGSAGSASEAQGLLDKMKTLNLTLSTEDIENGAHLILDADTYCNAILAWAKNSVSSGAVRANDILLEMIDRFNKGAFPSGSEPSLIAFNGVMAAWGRQGRADMAESILKLMDEVRLKCTNLTPDAISYNSVVHAYLRSDDKELALQKVSEIVKFMEDNCHKQPAIKPNVFTYNTLMKCWIQSDREDVAEQSEATLMRIQRLWDSGDISLQPTNRMFNMVINAYAKGNSRDAARKAVLLLESMKQSELCQPDVISYTSVIECLSKSTDPQSGEKAEELLSEAFQRYQETKDNALRPNARTFAMVILTLARTNGSVVRARELLVQLLELYEETNDPDLRPNQYHYNYVLNCAANTIEETKKLEAFQVATLTYQEMRKSNLVRPDSFTYAFWLKCCNNLIPPGDLRKKCVEYSFEECRKEGLVSKEVLLRLTQGNPPKLVDKLLDFPQSSTANDTKRPAYRRVIKVQDLPKAWSRNIYRK